jgi:hypothetical protein
MYPRFAMSIDNPPDSPTHIPYWDYGEFKRNGAQHYTRHPDQGSE